MTRTALSFLLGALVLAAGGATAWLQCANHARAALLDRLQREVLWFERERSELRERIERREHAADVEETRASGPRDVEERART